MPHCLLLCQVAREPLEVSSSDGLKCFLLDCVRSLEWADGEGNLRQEMELLCIQLTCYELRFSNQCIGTIPGKPVKVTMESYFPIFICELTDNFDPYALCIRPFTFLRDRWLSQNMTWIYVEILLCHNMEAKASIQAWNQEAMSCNPWSLTCMTRWWSDIIHSVPQIQFCTSHLLSVCQQ